MSKVASSIKKILLALVCLLFPFRLDAWTLGTSSPSATAGFAVDRINRRDVLAFYHTIYNASENYAANRQWTGNVTTGVPGTTSAAFKADVLRRINFYRALCGLPSDIALNDTLNAKCQEAALMFSANKDIAHNPPPSWTYYTANAAEVAGKSNIAYGSHGPGAVDPYMEAGFIDADCRDFECAGRFYLQSNTARIKPITFREKWLKCFSGATAYCSARAVWAKIRAGCPGFF